MENRFSKAVETVRHWRAFQRTAIKLNCWKFRFVFHDVLKLLNILVLGDEIATKLHRKFSSHHEQNGKIRDVLQAVIDWECARITKPSKPLTARQTWIKFYSHISGVEAVLNSLGL